MMKQKNRIMLLVVAVLLVFYVPTLKAVDIMKILEGYGRDSISTFSTQHAQSEAARVFNLLLETNGEITAEKAETYLNESNSPIMTSYLAVILADYAFVNYNFESGLHYLKRGVDEHDAIRNDSYYRLVLARAQKAILESPGKIQGEKESVLNDYSPRAIIKKPIIKKVDIQSIQESQKTIPQADEIVSNDTEERNSTLETKTQEKTQAKPKIIEDVKPHKEKIINYRVQIGAFGVQDNALRRKVYFEEFGYIAHIEIKQSSGKTLYFVQLGEYETYQQAKSGLNGIKSSFPAEDGFVVRTNK